MKITSVPLAVIIFVVLFGGIGFTSRMNWWQTETQKIPVRYSEGEAAGQYNPADIRGSYTFGDVSDLFKVPLEDLQAAFQIPADVDPSGYQLKSLEDQYAVSPVEIGTGSVRMFVAFYLGLPFDLASAEETYLLPEALEILKARGKLLPEQAEYVESHIVVLEANPAAAQTRQPTSDAGESEGSPLPTTVEETAPTPLASEHVAPEKTVTGKTTFQNLIDWGLTQAEIEAVLGGSMPAPNVVVKDYATQQGLTFSELKSRLQAVVNSHK